MGFLALAVYDKASDGGNGDGKIDVQDSVYLNLRLWLDNNHDGQSQTGELMTLSQAGLKSISLDYTRSRFVDAYGNIFRYRTKVVWERQGGGPDARWVYDVFPVVEKSH